MQDVSLYDVLGVPPDATAEQIRLAFLSLAHRFHPDLNADDCHEERFKQLRHAYEILSNPERREIYDRTHDTYATVIRQTAPPTPEDKQRNWVGRASASTFAFKTKWLKDKKVNLERWFFIVSAVASVALVFWAVQYITHMRRQITEPNHLAQTQNEIVLDSEIPQNPRPEVSTDLRKYFIKNEPVVDENIKPAGKDDLDSIGRLPKEPIALPAAEDVFAIVDDQSDALPQAWLNPDPLPGYGIQSSPASPINHIPADSNVLRPEIRADYWVPRIATPNQVPRSYGREPVPSQAELADAMANNSVRPSGGYQPPQQYHGTAEAYPSYGNQTYNNAYPSTGYAAPGSQQPPPIDSYQHGPSRAPMTNPLFTPPTVREFAPPSIQQFSPPTFKPPSPY